MAKAKEPRVKKLKPEPRCRRIGTKRSDLRCMDPNGDVWASPFEFNVYDAIDKAGRHEVRRAGDSDSLAYGTSVKQGRCEKCGSHSVVQDRTYTPDLHIVRQGDALGKGGYYIEVKGYLPGPKRNLFRQVTSQHPGVDIRIVAQSDHWVTKGKTRLSDWAKRYKIKLIVWKGELPEEW